MCIAAGFAARAGWLAVKKLEHWPLSRSPASLLASTHRELQLILELSLLRRLELIESCEKKLSAQEREAGMSCTSR